MHCVAPSSAIRQRSPLSIYGHLFAENEDAERIDAERRS